MSDTTYWASRTDRRPDGIPVDSARDAAFLHHRYGWRIFGVTTDG